jgi:hypothetical protein
MPYLSFKTIIIDYWPNLRAMHESTLLELTGVRG